MILMKISDLHFMSKQRVVHFTLSSQDQAGIVFLPLQEVSHDITGTKSVQYLKTVSSFTSWKTLPFTS